MQQTIVGNVQLVAGGPDLQPTIRLWLEENGIDATSANPDFMYQSFGNYGVDEARALRERASRRGITGRRVFVIEAATMTVEAQNALLKTLEEPADEALFVIVVPSPLSLLPTIRSRAQIVTLLGKEQHGEIDAKAFIASSSVERIEMLKPLLEKGDDDKRDMGAIIRFLGELEMHVATLMPSERRLAVEPLYRARRYAMDKGALIKPLLEQVALLVPRVQ